MTDIVHIPTYVGTSKSHFYLSYYGMEVPDESMEEFSTPLVNKEFSYTTQCAKIGKK